MKIISAILIVFSTALIGFAQTGKIVPLVDLNIRGIIGGVRDGKWVSSKETVPKVTTRKNYSVIGIDNKRTKMFGGKPQPDEICPSFFSVSFETEMRSGIALGAGANWNPQPRVPVDFSTSSETYKQIVADVLRTKGITAPKVNIRQAFRVDLDGDGVEEVVLSATSYKNENLMPGTFAGDYSFVMLRKIVFGKVEDVIIAGEFYGKNEEAVAQGEYAISAIADLNGDGNMEIVTKSNYFEGGAASVFEIKCTKIVEVLSIGCGV